MFKKIGISIALIIFIFSFLGAQDQVKDMKDNWDKVLESYKASPDSQATLEGLNNFAERWRDVNKFRAARAKYLQGMIYYRDKKYNTSFEVFGELVDKYSSSPYADGAMYKMGECQYNIGNYTKAMEIWNNFRFKYNNSLFKMEAVYGISLCHLNLEEFKKADRELSGFLSSEPFYKDDDNIKLIGGIIDYYLGRYKDSTEKLKRLKSDVAYYYNGHSLLKLQEYPKAASSFKKIAVNYPESKYNASALYNKAEAFYKGEKYDVAKVDYTSFIAKFPNDMLTPYSELKKGSSLFKMRKYEDANKAFSEVLESAGDLRVKAYAQYLKGECYRKLGNIEVALKMYNRVISDYDKVYDAYASAQLRAGWCYSSLKDYAKAQQVLLAFSQKFVTHEGLPLAYYLLGNANFQQKEYSLAIERYRYLLQKFKYSNLSEAAMLMTAMCYDKQQEYGMLASELSHSLNMISRKFQDPEGKNIRARTYFYLGQAYYKTGLFSPAANAFKTILDDYYESDITTEARANLAWCFYELENYKGARTMARDVINSNLQDKKIKKACEILIAHSYFSEKNFAKAAEKYQEFAYTYRKSSDIDMTAEALFQQGKVYEYMESYGDAIESWRAVAVNYPKSKRAAEATLKMSDVYFKAQQYDKAIQGFKAVMEQWPKSDFAEDAMLSIAEVYYNSGKEAKAVIAYKDFLKKYPDSTKITSVEEGMERATYVKAEKSGDPDLLLEYYEKYPESNLAVSALYNAAEIYYKNNKFEKSIATFNKLIEEFPNDSMAVNAHYYIPACYTELNKPEDAIEAYKAFLKNYSKHELAAEVMFNLATTAFTTKDYVTAIFYYGRVLERFKDSNFANNALYNTALAYNELGKYDDAIRTYRQFIKDYSHDDKSKGLLVYIASLYFEQKRYKDAIAAYEDVMENGTEEEKVQAVYSIGSIYGSLEEVDKQIETYNKLIEYKPLDNIYRLNGLVDLAGKYEEKEDWVNAVRIYKLVKSSGGNKEYVSFATDRIPTIMQAYPDLFKKETETEPKKTEKK